jgi:hypothetical protein
MYFSLMRYPWYRWIRCLFGSRSFKKINEFGNDTTYCIIKGQKVEKVVEKLLADGFVEEWPMNPDGPRRQF